MAGLSYTAQLRSIARAPSTSGSGGGGWPWCSAGSGGAGAGLLHLAGEEGPRRRDEGRCCESTSPPLGLRQGWSSTPHRARTDDGCHGGSPIS
ncbi:hypothetical protein ACP70R_008650 [Stipagrostis hirtigluma subsp. patula]